MSEQDMRREGGSCIYGRKTLRFLPGLRNSPDSSHTSFLYFFLLSSPQNAAFACLKSPGHVSPLPSVPVRAVAVVVVAVFRFRFIV